MNYHPMVPPFGIKSFDEMTKKEAELHFNWFIQEIPNRLELLKKIVQLQDRLMKKFGLNS